MLVKKKIIISSLISIIILITLVITYIFVRVLPEQSAEKRFAQYLNQNFTDEISFSVSYIFGADIYVADCMNSTTKEKFLIYEYDDGSFGVYAMEYHVDWIKDKSNFIRYEIVDNHNIKIYYSLCFENNEDCDLSVVSISARFDRKKLQGWIGERDLYVGYVAENVNSPDIVISKGEKKIIDVEFEGVYLGGNVDAGILLLDNVFVDVVPKTDDTSV